MLLPDDFNQLVDKIVCPPIDRSFAKQIDCLSQLGHKDMPGVIGGVIPPQDYDELYRDGALAIFGPGTALPTAAVKILEVLELRPR